MIRAISILTFVAAVAFAVSPLLSSGFNGFTAGQFPVPQTDPPIQPAGWAFSIWLVIYIWLIVGTGYGLLRRGDDPGWDRARRPLLASLVVGTAWIPVANVSPFWAVVLIWAMLATAALALLRAPRQDGWWLAAPVGLYTGWLAAASCVATAILLTGHGAVPVVPIHAAFLILACVIAVTLLRVRAGTPTLAVATGWALIGVIASNLSPMLWPMILVAGVGLVLLVPPALVRPRT